MNKTGGVPFKEKFFFSLGDFFGGAGGMITAVYAVYLAFNGLPPEMWGSILLIAKIWDAVTDPMMGVISDNTRSKYGRRRPYLFIGGVTVIFAMIMLFIPLYGLESVWFKFFFYLLAYLIYSTVSTIIGVPYSAMLNEITADPDERNKINTLRLVFSMLSGAISAAVPMILIGLLQDKKTNVNTFSIIMIIGFGLLYSVPLILSAIFSRERVPVPDEKTKFFLKDFVRPLKVKSFVCLVIMYFAAYASMDLITTNIVFLATYALKLSYSPVIILAIIMVAYAAMIPVHNKLMKTRPKAFLYRVGIPLYIAGLAVLCLFPSEKHQWLLPIIAALVGIGLSGCQLLPWYIFPDVADIGELKWGKRNAGAFSGLMTFIRKTTAAFAIGISGWILWLAGFISPTTDAKTGIVETFEQSKEAVLALRLIVLVPVVILIIAAFIASLKLKITPERSKLVSRALSLKRDGREEELSPGEKAELDNIIKECV